MTQIVHAHTRRPGRLELPRIYWILLAASASWLIILAAHRAFNWAALAAAGLL